MSVQQPGPVFARVVGDGLLHQGDGLVAAADESQRLRLQAEVVDVARLRSEQPRDERQHL